MFSAIDKPSLTTDTFCFNNLSIPTYSDNAVYSIYVHILVHTHTHTHTHTYIYIYIYARWFKYDRDYLCVNKPVTVPVIFELPCIYIQGGSNMTGTDFF